MNLADVFTVTFVILGLMAIFVAYWLVVAGLFPACTERWAERFGAAPVKAGVVGLVSLVPLVTIGIIFTKAMASPLGKMVGVIFVVALILAALAGAAGIALRVGQGLRSAKDEGEPWRRVLRGGVVLALTLGTIVLLPVILGAGFGALILAKTKRNGAVTAANAAVVDPVTP